ncbi:MAG: family N-acetyltransferase [Chitinophagaceae bacterium]|jgi:RimJ/RimL family protein N-acetyltransferase|nr:family N-acetyltransferase [Chitinophagaceae bacterium]
MGGVILRTWRIEDAEQLAQIANNREVWRNLRDRFPHPYTIQDAHERIYTLADEPPPRTNYCIEYQGKVAGSIGVMPQDDIYRKTIEIGYFVGEPFWGKGIASTAIGLMMQHVEKEFDVVRVFAGVFEHNKGSMQALRKNGFYLESIRRKAVFKDGAYLDDYTWVKLLPLK